MTPAASASDPSLQSTQEPSDPQPPSTSLEELPQLLRQWAAELGFQKLGITDADLGKHPVYLQRWLDARRHGEMDWMSRHAAIRAQPSALMPRVIRIIAARMNYLEAGGEEALETLGNPTKGYISRYALGRDYHKIVRKRLAKIAARLQGLRPDCEVRAFCDSAPVMEKALAQKAGLGWIGKNTLLLHQDAGSWFFLGEIYTSLELPVDSPHEPQNHCGSCRQCLDVCPTNAFVGPMQLDARRCISYLTIEHKGEIPESLRPLIGNRIFGCDDCQWYCPWTKRASPPEKVRFSPRDALRSPDLLELFLWSIDDFLRHTEGTALRRLSYEQWQRNLAVAIGNAPPTKALHDALRKRLPQSSQLVQQHISWALARQEEADAKLRKASQEASE